MADIRPQFKAPQPALEAMPGLGVAAAVFLIGAAGIFPWRVALVAAASCVGCALFRSVSAVRQRAGLERAADSLLRTGAAVHPQSALLVWRAARLTSDRERRIVSRSLARIAREVEGRTLPGPVPLNRRALRPQLPLLHALERRVGDVERPVAAWGMALVGDLLTDGYSSPLYVGGDALEPRPALERCLAALEGDRYAADDERAGPTAVVEPRRAASAGGR